MTGLWYKTLHWEEPWFVPRSGVTDNSVRSYSLLGWRKTRLHFKKMNLWSNFAWAEVKLHICDEQGWSREGTPVIWGEAEGAETVQSWEKKAQGTLPNVFKDLTGNGGGLKMEPSSFQWCTVTGQELIWHSWKNQETTFKWKKKHFLCGWLNTGTSCPERL